MNDDLRMLNLKESAKWLRISYAAIGQRIACGKLGYQGGLGYSGARPYFLADVLKARLLAGKVRRPRRRHKQIAAAPEAGVRSPSPRG
jgi:hypothetical protein